MEAMVRMYDLTHHILYLDHLRALTDFALTYRDDKHPGPESGDPRPAHQLPQKMPFDAFRGQAGIPAWGGRSVISGGLHCVDEVSFGYVYALAAFARIVAEHPNLWSLYGADAIRYANEVSKTVQAFFPQIVVRQAGSFTEA